MLEGKLITWVSANSPIQQAVYYFYRRQTDGDLAFGPLLVTRIDAIAGFLPSTVAPCGFAWGSDSFDWHQDDLWIVFSTRGSNSPRLQTCVIHSLANMSGWFVPLDGFFWNSVWRLLFSVILGREALSRSNFYKIDALMPLACTCVEGTGFAVSRLGSLTFTHDRCTTLNSEKVAAISNKWLVVRWEARRCSKRCLRWHLVQVDGFN